MYFPLIILQYLTSLNSRTNLKKNVVVAGNRFPGANRKMGELQLLVRRKGRPRFPVVSPGMKGKLPFQVSGPVSHQHLEISRYYYKNINPSMSERAKKLDIYNKNPRLMGVLEDYTWRYHRKPLDYPLP